MLSPSRLHPQFGESLLTMSAPNPDIFTPKPPRRRGTVPVRLPSFSPNDLSASRGPDPSSTFRPPHVEPQAAQQQYIPVPQSAPIPPFPPPFPHYFLPNSQTPVYQYVAPQGYPVAVPGKSLSELRARIGRERRSRNPERHSIREESLDVESRARSRSSSSSDSGRDSPPTRHHSDIRPDIVLPIATRTLDHPPCIPSHLLASPAACQQRAPGPFQEMMKMKTSHPRKSPTTL